MKRIKTLLLLIVILTIIPAIMSFQNSREKTKESQNKFTSKDNNQTTSIGRCIYSGGFCSVNGQIYKGISMY